MNLQFEFTEKSSKEECLYLLEKINAGVEYKQVLKSIIGGQDIGYHRYHQILDVMTFLDEWKFPKLWLKTLLVRGQTDEIFQRNFINLLTSWLHILNSIDTFNVNKSYEKELNKMRYLKIAKSIVNDPNKKSKINIEL